MVLLGCLRFMQLWLVLTSWFKSGIPEGEELGPMSMMPKTRLRTDGTEDLRAPFVMHQPSGSLFLFFSLNRIKFVFV
jgi:hypothetical protein